MGKLGPIVARVYDAWMEAVPPDVIRWALVGANSTTTRRASSATLARARSLLDAKAAAKSELTYFWVASDDEWPSPGREKEPTDPAFLFLMEGHSSVASQKKSWGLLERTNAVEMRFPSEFVWQLGVEAFVQFAGRIAAMLPFDAGYASPTLCIYPMTTSRRSEADCRAAALEHPGFDLDTRDDTRHASQVGGARWLTFLAPKMIASLGGEAALRRSLDERVEVTGAGKGLLLRAGTEPLADPGPDDLAALRSLAEALLPITRFERRLGCFEDQVELARWEYRFLGGEERALSELRARVRRTPDESDAHQSLVGFLVAQKDYDAAVQAAREAMTRFPPEHEVHLLRHAMADLAEEVERFEEAEAWWRELIRDTKVDPKNKDSLRNAARIKESLADVLVKSGKKKEGDHVRREAAALRESSKKSKR
jgi:hypothetical protein